MSDDERGVYIRGPWPGSGHPAGNRLRRQKPATPPIPHRRPASKFGPMVLTACVDCETPFRPDWPIPDDQLCRDCRGRRRAAAAPALFEVDE